MLKGLEGYGRPEDNTRRKVVDSGGFLNPYTTRPTDLKAGDQLCYVIVAVIGGNKDWAAYAGLAGWSPERAAECGEKLDREAAERLFSICSRAGLTYRA